MHDHKSENFIKINPNARRIASGLFKPRLVKPHTCFQRANRKTGRPQSGVKSATLCVWECSLIYRLFVCRNFGTASSGQLSSDDHERGVGVSVVRIWESLVVE
ncbi:hypothetical protein G5I_13823 [Acromyrmex echinatior]|uniref:Uncharacterized protein n=1 Tax=Acromyrmex echinatior TaxID=103372 RepID=F4X627_ACREC|nr:hypothetical protein G5I_13823 [Acromyrmex echinatior]